MRGDERLGPLAWGCIRAVALAVFLIGCVQGTGDSCAENGEATCEDPADPREPVRARLGAPCDADSECPLGAFCLASHAEAYLGGTVPRPTCVADCTEDPEACEAYDDAACVGTSDEGGGPVRALCFEGCSVGSGSAAKCHGASHVACEPLIEGALGGYCRPFCTLGTDCPSGFCDRRSGRCVGVAPITGDLPFGEPCDPTAAERCPGLCVSLTPEYAVCSHRCVFGEAGPCDNDEDLGGDGCLFVTPGGTLGDVGFCAALCDCGADCAHAGAACDPLGNLETAFGREGVCTPPELALGEPLVCGLEAG
jgi:hypothetical protein